MKMKTETLEPHPQWKGGHWSDSKCDYCGYEADMVCAGFYACFEHRERLLKERGHLAEEAYARQLEKLATASTE